MLYPKNNLYRQVSDLSGFWELRFDPDELGLSQGWFSGFPGGRPVAVPASWNDQFADGRDFLGPAWYQTEFDLPWGWQDRRIALRFGSVNYLAEAWLNGTRLGFHAGGHLPFEFDLTAALKPAGNRLVVRVDGRLAFDRVPPGNVSGDPADFFPNHAGNFPQAQFDFFPYCGIHRPVLLTAVPPEGLVDLTVRTELTGSGVRLWLRAERTGAAPARVRFRLSGQGREHTVEAEFSGAAVEAEIEVPQAVLWSPETPALYDLQIELLQSGQTVDAYPLQVGLRTVRVEGDRLLLNDRPIHLTGFGRHEDFPVVGRGLLPALIVKDYALMEWIGANSFRTSHYPYSEQMLDLADRLGFLVIDETPAVGLYFRPDGLEQRSALCRQYVHEIVARDKNHPSVIAWSLANEPHSTPPHAGPFFEALIRETRELDPTRPVTLVSFLGESEPALAACDLVCLNRYLGWYSQPGDLETALGLLSAELDALHTKFGKPLLLAEFGADAIAGQHAQPPEMFSEEYQAELLVRTIQLLRSKPYVVGEHIWNLCDFKTSQGITRAGALNHKGVFTRDRRPKLAAHRVRQVWRNDTEKE